MQRLRSGKQGAVLLCGPANASVATQIEDGMGEQAALHYAGQC